MTDKQTLFFTPQARFVNSSPGTFDADEFTVAFDYREAEVVAEVKRLTGGGANVAIEARGTQQTLRRDRERSWSLVFRSVPTFAARQRLRRPAFSTHSSQDL